MPEFAKIGLRDGAGQVWKRLQALSITVPLGQAPQAVFQQETAIAVDGHIATVYDRSLPVPDDPAHTFPVLHPVTGEPTGEVATIGDVTALIYSLYAALSAESEAP